ncbi:maltose acetyltransferase domain-containing protein [Oerskovia douganii]|uniref:maltose acetyltransferase domain-containing protein n=1 Tax=Oerskovia douganii TaxID=2762210 RepID=UPI001D0FC280|nr:maltose acetyltransferase domain-containing protein [Oerskovia douganii]
MTTEQYRTVRARMNTGEHYVDYGEGLEQLEAERVAGKELAYDFNHSRPGQVAERERILHELFGTIGERVWIEPPLSVSYGSHVHLGDDV